MSQRDDGGPAFPVSAAMRYYDGMSLRDYFAGRTMQAMVSTITTEDAFQRLRAIAAEAGLRVSEWIARESYKQADAMIATGKGA